MSELYKAQDENGSWWVYYEQPILKPGKNYWCAVISDARLLHPADHKSHPNWKNSLIEIIDGDQLEVKV